MRFFLGLDLPTLARGEEGPCGVRMRLCPSETDCAMWTKIARGGQKLCPADKNRPVGAIFLCVCKKFCALRMKFARAQITRANHTIFPGKLVNPF